MKKPMHTTALRKVGGSTMMAVPPALLEQLDLQAGSAVGLSIDGGRLVVTPRPRPRYALDELLAQCDAHATATAKPDHDHDWLQSPATGREEL